MLKRQERAIEQVIKLRAGIDEAHRRIDFGVYKAVRVENVPARVVAERLGLTRSRIYQMVKNHEERQTTDLDK